MADGKRCRFWGRSRCELKHSERDGGCAVFQGDLSTVASGKAVRSGFCQTRSKSGTLMNLSEYSGLAITCKATFHRTLCVNIRTESFVQDQVYQAYVNLQNDRFGPG